MTDLGSVGSDPCSRALSINSEGQIVGFTASVCGGNATHGFLWENGGPAIDLNTLVPPGSSLALTQPVSINDRGEIAGFGVLSNGDTHAFLLIPCDENHGDDSEGCEGEGEATTAAIQNNPARVAPMPTDLLGVGMTPGEMAARFRTRFDPSRGRFTSPK